MTIRQEWPNSSTALSTTDETELLHVYSTNAVEHSGATFYIYASAVGGTATVKYVSPAGVEKILGTATIPAGGTSVSALDFHFAVPEAKLYITMASGSAATVTAEAIIY